MADFNAQTSAEEVCDAFSPQVKGKTFLITGASANGMGAKYALVLARHAPAQVLLVARAQAKVDPVIADIRAVDPRIDAKFVPCDLSDQQSVRRAAAGLLADASVAKIDIVINNVGVMAVKEYTLDAHGNEVTLSANHLGHFLLTGLLMPKILAAEGAGARIVNITSHGHRIGPFRFDDPTFRNGREYGPWSAYGQSKTANVLFSAELARRLHVAGHNAQSFAVHPGLIMTTGLGTHLDFVAEVPAILAAVEKNNPGEAAKWTLDGQAKNDSQGCASALVAALHPGWKDRSGAYVEDCQVGEAMAYVADVENAKKLWAYSEEVVGQKFDI